MKRLIQDADGVYMIDEECLKKREAIERQKEMEWQQRQQKNGNQSLAERNGK